MNLEEAKDAVLRHLRNVRYSDVHFLDLKRPEISPGLLMELMKQNDLDVLIGLSFVKIDSEEILSELFAIYLEERFFESHNTGDVMNLRTELSRHEIWTLDELFALGVSEENRQILWENLTTPPEFIQLISESYARDIDDLLYAPSWDGGSAWRGDLGKNVDSHIANNLALRERLSKAIDSEETRKRFEIWMSKRRK